MGGGRTAPTTPTGWVGWIWFAAVLLIVVGAFNAVSGLVALFRKSYYYNYIDNYYGNVDTGILVFNLTTWGWIHLVIGVLAVITGIVLFSGAMWARVVAVILVAINAIAQLAFLSVYPVWATLIIALDVLVIWAVIAHGAEVKAKYWT